MSGFYSYLLIEQDGSVTMTDEESDLPPLCCWPNVVRFCLVDYGSDVEHEIRDYKGEWIPVKSFKTRA